MTSAINRSNLHKEVLRRKKMIPLHTSAIYDTNHPLQLLDKKIIQYKPWNLHKDDYLNKALELLFLTLLLGYSKYKKIRQKIDYYFSYFLFR